MLSVLKEADPRMATQPTPGNPFVQALCRMLRGASPQKSTANLHQPFTCVSLSRALWACALGGTWLLRALCACALGVLWLLCFCSRRGHPDGERGLLGDDAAAGQWARLACCRALLAQAQLAPVQLGG